MSSSQSRLLPKLLLKPPSVLVVYIIVAIVASMQMILLGTSVFNPTTNGGLISDVVNTPEVQQYFTGHYLTQYNNYVIFKCSFFHLLKGVNLYGLHPADHWDLFKYSPTFALFMGLFAWMPDWLGLSIWCILNVVVLYFAINMLPFNTKTRALLLWFLLIELLTSLQNCQVNGVLCGLMVMGFCLMQRGKMQWVALMLVMAAFIKIYGAAAFCLFLFFPDKIKFILWCLLWSIILFLLPLVVTPFHTLIAQYQNWMAMMSADQAASYGVSVMGWMHTWFHFDDKVVILATGLVCLTLPFLNIKLYQNPLYQLLMLASVLIWVIIFNHKAESATYIIAVAGAGIWYFARKPSVWRILVLYLVFIFTCLSYTDLFYKPFAVAVVRPYAVKALPCVLVWGLLLMELILMKPEARLYNIGKKAAG